MVEFKDFTGTSSYSGLCSVCATLFAVWLYVCLFVLPPCHLAKGCVCWAQIINFFYESGTSFPRLCCSEGHNESVVELVVICIGNACCCVGCLYGHKYSSQ